MGETVVMKLRKPPNGIQFGKGSSQDIGITSPKVMDPLVEGVDDY